MSGAISGTENQHAASSTSSSHFSGLEQVILLLCCAGSQLCFLPALETLPACLPLFTGCLLRAALAKQRGELGL